MSDCTNRPHAARRFGLTSSTRCRSEPVRRSADPGIWTTARGKRRLAHVNEGKITDDAFAPDHRDLDALFVAIVLGNNRDDAALDEVGMVDRLAMVGEHLVADQRHAHET